VLPRDQERYIAGRQKQIVTVIVDADVVDLSGRRLSNAHSLSRHRLRTPSFSASPRSRDNDVVLRFDLLYAKETIGVQCAKKRRVVFLFVRN